VVYDQLERVLILFDRDEGSAWIAAACDTIDHDAAREAAALLRAGDRDQAKRVLARALWRLAGPTDGSGLTWWRPARRPETSGIAEPGGPTMRF
jgi:hypothetical protein